MAVRWVFTDPQTNDTYTFAVNPNAGGSPQYQKKVNYQTTSAVDGSVIAYEGRSEASQADFSGVILERDQYDAMVTWFSKRYPISYEDDLGRTFSIYITSFEPKRERAVQHPWKHSYTVKYLILSVTEPPA